MAKYLIDVNLPYRFSLWSGDDFIHVRDLDETWTDIQIWDYAKARGLTIVSKDADFSNMLILSRPPPRVIHIRLGNMRMRDFYQVVSDIWQEVCRLSEQYKLVTVYRDRLEGLD